MLLLGVDFETNTDNTETALITEVGAILTSFTPPYTIYEGLEEFCYEKDYPPLSDFIVELTHITDEILKQRGIPRKQLFEERLIPMIRQADYVVAYNKKFDENVFRATCKKFNLEIPSTPWLCAMTDVPYPEKFTCKKLSHLAYEHGILMHPDKLHRAFADVSLMFELLKKYDLQEILAYANEPELYLQAIFPPPWEDKGVGKAKAVKLGYSWEKAKHDDRFFPKCWVKKIKNSKVNFEKERAEKLALTIREIIL